MTNNHKKDLQDLLNNQNAYLHSRVVAGLRLDIQAMTEQRDIYLNNKFPDRAARIDMAIARSVTALDALLNF